MYSSGQFRSSQVRVFYHAHSEQAVIAHACHGHRYRPSLVPLSVPKKKGGVGTKGGPPALAGTREYEQSDRNW